MTHHNLTYNIILLHSGNKNEKKIHIKYILYLRKLLCQALDYIRLLHVSNNDLHVTRIIMFDVSIILILHLCVIKFLKYFTAHFITVIVRQSFSSYKVEGRVK